MPQRANAETDLYVQTLDFICQSDELRRELLWLRAMEKRDKRSARGLERVDPGLLARVADVRARVAALPARSASKVYGAAHDERFEAALESLRPKGQG